MTATRSRIARRAFAASIVAHVALIAGLVAFLHRGGFRSSTRLPTGLPDSAQTNGGVPRVMQSLRVMRPCADRDDALLVSLASLVKRAVAGDARVAARLPLPLTDSEQVWAVHDSVRCRAAAVTINELYGIPPEHVRSLFVVRAANAYVVVDTALRDRARTATFVMDSALRLERRIMLPLDSMSH